MMLRHRSPLLLLPTLLALPPLARAQDLLLAAKTIVVADDTVLSPGQLLLRAGKVAYVGADVPADARANAKRDDFGDAWIVPGFVLATTVGRDKDLGEGALPFTPDLRAAEAFDPWQEELAALPDHGVTFACLSPSPRNLAGGLAAWIKPGKDGGSIAAPDAHLCLSLTTAARSPEREPTSLMGAIGLLRSAFTAAKGAAAAGPDVAVLRSVLQGNRRVAICADTFAELSAALDLAREFGFQPVLVGAGEAHKLLPRIQQQGAAVVLDALRPESRLAQLELPARLHEKGIAFAFGGRPEVLRLSAALAVRHGLERKQALQALTRNAVQLLEPQSTVGGLRQGAAGDCAVFSGDPLDLTSQHLATFVDGQRVVGDAPPRPAAGAR
jgi:imidazolonepropionase-like amidohydrolase